MKAFLLKKWHLYGYTIKFRLRTRISVYLYLCPATLKQSAVRIILVLVGLSVQEVGSYRVLKCCVSNPHEKSS